MEEIKMKAKTFLCIFLISACSASLCFGAEKQSVQLRLNLQKGNCFRSHDISEGENTFIRSQDTIKQNTNTIHENEYLLECLGIDPNGVMEIRKTWIAAKFNMRMEKDDESVSTYEYDSAKTNKPENKQKYAFARLINESVLLRMRPDGTIIDANGIDRLAEKVIKADETKDREIPDEKRTSMKKWLCMQFQSLPGALIHYPGKAVSVGDSWQGPWGRCGGPVCPQSTWTLKSIEGSLAKIEVKDVNRPTIKKEQQGNLNIETNMTTTSTINLSLDIKTGLIKSCQGKTEQQGVIKHTNTQTSSPDAAATVQEAKVHGTGTFRITTEPLKK